MSVLLGLSEETFFVWAWSLALILKQAFKEKLSLSERQEGISVPS